VDAPPMNELITVERGVLVATTEGRQKLRSGICSTKCARDGIEQAIAMAPARWRRAARRPAVVSEEQGGICGRIKRLS